MYLGYTVSRGVTGDGVHTTANSASRLANLEAELHIHPEHPLNHLFAANACSAYPPITGTRPPTGAVRSPYCSGSGIAGRSATSRPAAPSSSLPPVALVFYLLLPHLHLLLQAGLVHGHGQPCPTQSAPCHKGNGGFWRWSQHDVSVSLFGWSVRVVVGVVALFVAAALGTGGSRGVPAAGSVGLLPAGRGAEGHAPPCAG